MKRANLEGRRLNKMSVSYEFSRLLSGRRLTSGNEDRESERARISTVNAAK